MHNFENFSHRLPNPSSSLFSSVTFDVEVFLVLLVAGGFGAFAKVLLTSGVGFALWVFLAPPAGRLPSLARLWGLLLSFVVCGCPRKGQVGFWCRLLPFVAQAILN